jgi:pseudomonalisin
MSRLPVMRISAISLLVLASLAVFLSLEIPAHAQLPSSNPMLAEPRDRITGFVDDAQLVTLHGNRHPLAVPRYDTGAVSPEYRMERMVLTLLPDDSQQEALTKLLEEQHDPESPNYHQWLTPEQYGQRFGVSEADAEQVTSWLQTHGITVEEVTPGRRSIVFSGSASQVESAFHTGIHTYKIGNEVHHANISDPSIPAAFAGVVGGIVSLHDFRSVPMNTGARLPKASPEFTYGGSYYLAPADFATIYDLGPAYQAAITGSGQSIAIVARSNINIADVRQFRSSFGLPANDPQIIVNGTDPGLWSSAEETEADLDVEWSGAVAKGATIQFVVSQSTSTSDGSYLSAQYIVNHNLAPVMSMSFGQCEAALGSSGNNFFNSLWQQAAAQGITVFVSSGDSGAAGCDSSSATLATQGRAVNGLCSSPYSVCVGGTEFNDTTQPSLYWSSFNAAGTQSSALSYIPEVVWNESSSGGLWASGGGVSTLYAKPSWQAGTGVPADGMRDVPDVALTAAGHDGYLIYQDGELYVVGGTSAASPSFAGIMALVEQHAAARQGNANPVLYPLATKQGTGGASVFHDITAGNNSVPGVTGFTATTGYDRATGLGSVDGSVLVNHWSDGTSVPSFQLASSAASFSLTAGSNKSVTLNVTVSGGFNAAIAFSVTGLPSGVTATFTPASLAAPGSGSSVLQLTATSSAVAGVYSATVSAAGGSISQQKALSITVAAAPTFALTASAASVSLAAGSSKSLTLTTTPNSTFNAAITFSITGLPSGVTAVFAPASLAAPGAGSSILQLSAANSAAAGVYSATVSAISGSISQQKTLSITVAAAVRIAPTFSLTPSATSVSVATGSSKSLTLTTTPNSTFNAGIALTVTGLPSGLKAQFSPSNLVAAPGLRATTVIFSAASTLAPKAYLVTVTAVGGGITQKQTLTVNIPSFSLSASATSLALVSKATGTVKFTTAALGGFNSTVALSVTGLPADVTASFSPQTVSSPGSGVSTLTLTKGTGAKNGNSRITITATGASVTKTEILTLTVN